MRLLLDGGDRLLPESRRAIGYDENRAILEPPADRPVLWEAPNRSDCDDSPAAVSCLEFNSFMLLIDWYGSLLRANYVWFGLVPFFWLFPSELFWHRGAQLQ